MIDFFIFVRESCKETTYSRSQGIVISYSLGFLPHSSPSEKEKEKAYFFLQNFILSIRHNLINKAFSKIFGNLDEI